MNHRQLQPQSHSVRRKILRYWPLYLMMLPGIVYLIINNHMPMAGLIIAFKRYNYSLGIFDSPWYGLKNFTYLFVTKDAMVMVRNTVLYNLTFIVLGNLLGLAVAIIMDTIKNRFFRNMSQVVILIPYLLSIVIVSYIVYAFLNPTNGFVNNTLLTEETAVQWYNDPKPWPVILTVVYLWMTFGYTSIIYYSTLIGIDKTLYEAAIVDGAGTWGQIRYVTLPCMKRTMIIMGILAVGRIFTSDFGLFYQVPMNSGMLYNTTQTIDNQADCPGPSSDTGAAIPGRWDRAPHNPAGKTDRELWHHRTIVSAAFAQSFAPSVQL